MDQINQFRAYVRDIDNRFGIWKKQILSLMLFVAVVLVFKSYNNQHQEVRLIQQSLSNFYRDFDVSMLKDPSELKNLVAKIAEISAPITSLEQIHKASRDVDKKIEILQNFELDKTGRADLASKAAGGKIAGIGAETQLFYSCNVFMKLLNCPTRIYGPEKVIESSTQPGQCFCFLGQKGSVILRLAGSAVVDAMTVEHIPKQMSPKGGVREAPKHFNCSVSEVLV